jgi:protein SCO1/2
MGALHFILFTSLLLIRPLTADEPAAKELPPCCQKELSPGKPLTDGSIYQLESKWTSDVGREIRLGVLRGKPQVLVMFFAQCEFACPILLHDLKKIEATLPESLRDEVGFTLVTFDVQRDTVEALHKYRETHQLSTRRWTLLRGGTDDVRELAALLGINYRPDARGQFAHSNLITILDREGEIALQIKGLNNAPDGAVAALAKLAGK